MKSEKFVVKSDEVILKSGGNLKSAEAALWSVKPILESWEKLEVRGRRSVVLATYREVLQTLKSQNPKIPF